jgi:hypothetical protein
VLKATDVDFDQTLETLHRYSEHALLRDVLDQTSVLAESVEQVHDELVRVEGTSIDNYIAESDTLVDLHSQVRIQQARARCPQSHNFRRRDQAPWLTS